MRHRTTKRFRELLAGLPIQVRTQARRSYRLMLANPRHSGLQLKLLDTSRQMYSVRVNLEYRARAILAGDEFVWFWKGNHDDYERILGN